MSLSDTKCVGFAVHGGPVEIHNTTDFALHLDRWQKATVYILQNQIYNQIYTDKKNTFRMSKCPPC